MLTPSASSCEEGRDRVRHGGGTGTCSPRALHGRNIAQGASTTWNKSPGPGKGLIYLPGGGWAMLAKSSLNTAH